jgi:hypothetical protein
MGTVARLARKSVDSTPKKDDLVEFADLVDIATANDEFKIREQITRLSVQ